MKIHQWLSNRSHLPRNLAVSRLFHSTCRAALFILLAAAARNSAGQSYDVTGVVGTGTGTLYWAIQQADAYGNGRASWINLEVPFSQINLTQPLPDITVGLTINGSRCRDHRERPKPKSHFLHQRAGADGTDIQSDSRGRLGPRRQRRHGGRLRRRRSRFGRGRVRQRGARGLFQCRLSGERRGGGNITTALGRRGGGGRSISDGGGEQTRPMAFLFHQRRRRVAARSPNQRRAKQHHALGRQRGRRPWRGRFS